MIGAHNFICLSDDYKLAHVVLGDLKHINKQVAQRSASGCCPGV